MFSFVAAAVLAAIPLPAPSPGASASPVPEIAHVVTSDRGLESSARTARTTYVVTAADIARNGYRTIADAISSLPGVNVARYGAFGALTSVGIRGSSPAQVLVLMDGLPVAGGQIGDIDLEQYGVAGVDRVEVVEGGGSTLYGSGSIGGVINIITTKRSTPSSATVSTGSFDTQTYAFDTPYASFQRTYAGNNYALPSGGARTNDAAGLTSGTLAFDRALGAFDLGIAAQLTNTDQGAPGPIGYTSTTGQQNGVTQNYRLHLDRRSARSTVTLSVGSSSQRLSYACDTPVDSGCPNAYAVPTPSATAPPYAELLTDQRTMLSVANATGDERSRVVYGVDLSRGTARVDGGTGSACTGNAYYYSSCGVTAYEASIASDAYSQTAAYVQSQWYFRNGASVYAGLRGERDLNSLGTASGAALSPSIGGIVPLGGAMTLRLNAATAFRAPTAEELFYPPVGVYSNPALVPEHTRVGDATLIARTSIGQVTAGWFTTSGSNLIVDANPQNYDYEPENVGRASIQGLTFGLTTRPFNHLTGTIAVTNLYRAQNLETNRRIVGRGPVFAAVVGLRYQPALQSRFDGWGVTVTSDGQAETPAYASQPFYAQAAAFTTVDLYAGYRIAPQIVLGVRGYNLLDDRYAVYNGYPMPGPSFAVELRTKQ